MVVVVVVVVVVNRSEGFLLVSKETTQFQLVISKQIRWYFFNHTTNYVLFQTVLAVEL